MFGRKPTPPAAPGPEDETFTFLAQGFECRGILRFEDTVRINGYVVGEVHTKGTLILGAHAVIEGDVTAVALVSDGCIKGNVTVTDKVELRASAALTGTIKTPVLKIEEGVRFYGTCEAPGNGAPAPPAAGTPGPKTGAS